MLQAHLVLVFDDTAVWAPMLARWRFADKSHVRKQAGSSSVDWARANLPEQTQSRTSQRILAALPTTDALDR